MIPVGWGLAVQVPFDEIAFDLELSNSARCLLGKALMLSGGRMDLLFDLIDEQSYAPKS